MDRLSTLIALASLALSGAACEEGASPPPPPRVVAVTEARNAAADLAGFCDVSAQPGRGRPLALPPTDGSVVARPGRARWVSLWATWCRPCLEEMPLIQEWGRRLEAEGTPVDVTFVSVDESAEALETFRRGRPSIPASPRLADPASLEGLLRNAGLDPGATIPLHLFAGQDGRLRCARAGAVGPSHYEVVRSILAAPRL